tara:strand:+ start:539 stop:940 length:402 start_codon:yes stop_codon:yes gene_type:complete
VKSFYLFILFIFSTYLSHAQISWSTSDSGTCYWDNNQKEWTNCSNKKEFNSLFTFNKDVTMITHTTSELKSVYYIKSIENNEEDLLFKYEVISDVGNEYLMYFDLSNEQIRILSFKGEIEDWYMHVLSVKSVF